MTSEDLINNLKALGFIEVRRIGSHVMMKHPNYTQKVTLPIHSSRKLPIGTIKAILKVIVEAGVISKEEANNKILK